MEKEVLLKASVFFVKEYGVKFDFIRDESVHFSVTVLCWIMQVGTSAYYASKKRPAKLIVQKPCTCIVA
jgi:hypothetical protein